MKKQCRQSREWSAAHPERRREIWQASRERQRARMIYNTESPSV